jgi:hypothetical protein
MADFMAPAQMMGQQLQGVLQEAAASADQARTNLAARQLRQQEMAKAMELDFTLADKLMPVNKELAFQHFNKALAPMGRSVSMEDFDVAHTIFSQAAELKQKGDLVGMQMLLKQSDKYLVNLADRQKAISMETEARQGTAQTQANTVQALQGENPQLAQARQLVNLAGMVGGDLTKVQPDQLVAMTGTTDPTEQQNRLIQSQAMIEGHETRTNHLATLFSLDPTSFVQSAHTTAQAVANPEVLAKGRIADLLQKPDRTESEERELMGKAFAYGSPQLQAAMQVKSSQRESDLLRAQLEDTQSRLSAMQTHSDTYQQAQTGASSITDSTRGLPDSGGPLTDEAAKKHLLAEGTRQVEGQAFLAKQSGRIQSLEQTATEAERQAQDLKKRQLGALPGQKDMIGSQLKEFDAMAKANRAQARLLRDENPYVIEQKRAELALLDDPKQKAEAQLALTELEAQRDKDLGIVEGEKARLERREKILRGKQPEADRKAEQEENLRSAAQAVDRIVAKGGSLTAAVRDAAATFGVSSGDLAKTVKEARGAGVPEAQLSLLDAHRDFRRVYRRDPSPSEANNLLSKVLTAYPGVNGDEIKSVLKDPNRPAVEVNLAGKASEEAAKDFTKSTRATFDQLKSAPILLRNIEEAKALIPQAKGFMGPGGDSLMEAAKFLNNRLGAKISVQGIKSAEELRTRIFFNIMENLKKMDAQPSQMQQQLMMDALGKLGTDPNALANVLDAYGDTIRDKVELFNREIEGAMAKGTDFPYDPRIQVQPRTAPTGEPLVKTDQDFNALPSGTVFVGPDGKKRRKP